MCIRDSLYCTEFMFAYHESQECFIANSHVKTLFAKTEQTQVVQIVPPQKMKTNYQILMMCVERKHVFTELESNITFICK